MLPLSSSMSSSRMSKTATIMEPFRKFHKDRYLAPHSATKDTSSGSAAASFEQMQKKNRFLGNDIPPVFAIIARAVRADQKLLGYQLAAYFDKPTARVQLIASSIAENDNMKICADGALLSKHKVTAKFSWGAECKQYAVFAKAEAGVLGEYPAARLEVEWERLPKIASTYAKKVSKYILNAAYDTGFRFERATNSEKEIELTAALPSQKSLNVIARIPEITMSRRDIYLPVTVPINPDGTFTIDKDFLSWIHKYINED
uniref:Zgc:136383 n=1 Tax=Danio rerio TaxID=7955 RepID=Q1RM99_DANRE|nr:Zgc:136383 [Danio rerio]